MPAPGGPSYKQSPAKPVEEDEDIPAAIPIIEKPKFLDGKMTWIGIGLFATSFALRKLGIILPESEIKYLLHWLSDNWSVIAEPIGVAMAGYGKIRRSPRFNKAKN